MPVIICNFNSSLHDYAESINSAQNCDFSTMNAQNQCVTSAAAIALSAKFMQHDFNV